MSQGAVRRKRFPAQRGVQSVGSGRCIVYYRHWQTGDGVWHLWSVRAYRGVPMVFLGGCAGEEKGGISASGELWISGLSFGGIQGNFYQWRGRAGSLGEKPYGGRIHWRQNLWESVWTAAAAEGKLYLARHACQFL